MDRVAWESELQSLEDNGTWVPADLPPGRIAIGSWWVFKLKEDGRYKARLEAKGYSQEAGIGYQETFAPVAKFTTFRALMALAAENNWEIEGMDVKTVFFHGHLAKVIHMEMPEGLAEDSPGQVCRLLNTNYGLKQSPRVWYAKIHQFFAESGFVRSAEDHSLFVHQTRRLVILLYVDDLVLAAAIQKDINWIKESLKAQFEMTELGKLRNFIGVEVFRDRSRCTLKLSQERYISRVLKDHGMEWCTAVATPVGPGIRFEVYPVGYEATPSNRLQYQSAVGSLMYCMLGTRPDIAYAASMVSKYCTNPNSDHWMAVKRIFRYLAGAGGLGITYGIRGGCEGFCDSDWGGSEDRRPTSGYVFLLNGGAISWASRKQSVVALASTEAQYMAITKAVKEVLWLRTLFTELGAWRHAKVICMIFSDNHGAIALSRNPGYHAQSNHIDIQFHFIRQHVDPENGTINLLYFPTGEMVADVLTKGLVRGCHQQHTGAMGHY